MVRNIVAAASAQQQPVTAAAWTVAIQQYQHTKLAITVNKHQTMQCSFQRRTPSWVVATIYAWPPRCRSAD